ncbi:MAG: hypothetical protein WDA01_10860, partial [Methanothrix sp.]
TRTLGALGFLCLLCILAASVSADNAAVSADMTSPEGAKAPTDVISLGVADVSLDLSGIGEYTVETTNLSERGHSSQCSYGSFDYDRYHATITSDSGQVLMELQILPSGDIDLGTSINHWTLRHALERWDGVPSRVEATTNCTANSTVIDGKHAATRTYVSEDPVIYAASFSPDEEDGWGAAFFYIKSDFPQEITEELFQSIDVEMLTCD